METNNFLIPCLCGRISLIGKRLPPIERPSAEMMIKDLSGYANFYRLGSMNGIHCLSHEKKTTIIVGNVHSPVFIGDPSEPSALTEETISSLNPNSMEGNFVLVTYAKSVGGTPTVSIAADKFGSRLLLYCQMDDSFIFSTHISGIRFLLGNRLPPVDKDSLLHYYHFGFTANDQTLFSGIKKIPPGSRLVISDQKLKMEKYFDLLDLYHPNDYIKMKEGEIADSIDSLLARAILHRNPEKESIALTLSGGVDSGFIAKKSRQLGIDVIGYNLAYGKEYNEFSRVDRLKEELNISLKKLTATPEMILQSVEDANLAASEPVRFNDAAMRLLAVEAKKDGFASIWDGDGADRLFFGMNRQLKYLKLYKRYRTLKRVGMVSPLLWATGHLGGEEWRKLNILFRNWQIGIPPYPERKFGRVKCYDRQHEEYIYRLAIERYWRQFSNRFPCGDIVRYFTFQSIQMCPEMFFYPPAEQQMALGIHAVSPYWDERMVSLALSIPSFLKVKRGLTKYILRKAAALGKNGDYWMSAKIGLQDATKFCLKSESGRAWHDEKRALVQQSDEFHLLSSLMPPEEIDPSALTNYAAWKKANNI